jgi:DNA-binding HxlR family transcriptional regulator
MAGSPHRSGREAARARDAGGRRPATTAVADRPGDLCPHFHVAIELVGKRWTGAILWVLTDGPVRFAELSRRIPGVSDRLLSQRLRELEDWNLVDRIVDEGSPVRVSYRLTEKGAELEPALRHLGDWAQRWHA